MRVIRSINRYKLPGILYHLDGLKNWYGMVIYFSGPKGIIEGPEVHGARMGFIVLCWEREGGTEGVGGWLSD